MRGRAAHKGIIHSSPARGQLIGLRGGRGGPGPSCAKRANLVYTRIHLMDDAMTVTKTRTFRSGNSEAVRLPKDVAFGEEVELVIVRSGDVLTLYRAATSIPGSRYVVGGSVAEDWDKRRQLISSVAGRAARLVVKADLKDPMSGFFLMRRQAFDEVGSQPIPAGIQNSPRPVRFCASAVALCGAAISIPSAHLRGEQARQHGCLGIRHVAGRQDVRPIHPSALNTFRSDRRSRLLVHMTALAVALHVGLAFTATQTIAVLTSITFNFALNNLITIESGPVTLETVALPPAA